MQENKQTRKSRLDREAEMKATNRYIQTLDETENEHMIRLNERTYNKAPDTLEDPLY
jgi:hypothetical protein